MLNNIVLSKDDATDLQIDPSKTIIWTGAGISHIAPSFLPLGNDLTDAFLETAFGPKWKEFAAVWNNYFPSIRDSVQNGRWTSPEAVASFTTEEVDSREANERPRLEYIIGELDKLDKYFNSIRYNKSENQKRFSRKSVLAAISEFKNVEPCLFHYRLADLAKANAIMITSNFDVGIEKALGVDPTQIERVFETTAISNGFGGHIFHFHGIATDDPANLGATINTMSMGLNECFQRFLRSRFQMGYNIVFIGYSGMDFFDVEPFFKELGEENYTGKAIYLKHCKAGKEEDERDKLPKPYQYLLKPFQNQYIVYTSDTACFFDCLYDHYSNVVTSTKDCGAFKKAKIYLNDVVNSQLDEEEYYFINTFRICSQLNIHPGFFYPNWLDRIKNLFEIWKADGEKTLWNMTVIDGQKNDGIIEDIYSNNWGDETLEQSGMADVLRPYIKAWNKKHRTWMLKANQAFRGYGFPLPRFVIKKYVDKTEAILKENRTDEKSTDISRGTVMYLCGMQTKAAIFLYLKSHGIVKGRMLFLKECIDRLKKYPFTRFQYRTHYLSLCRQAAYIDAAIHKGQRGYEGDIQYEWDICMQTPNLFDAGQVLNARIIQAKQYGLDGSDELNQIRDSILELRKRSSVK